MKYIVCLLVFVSISCSYPVQKVKIDEQPAVVTVEEKPVVYVTTKGYITDYENWTEENKLVGDRIYIRKLKKIDDHLFEQKFFYMENLRLFSPEDNDPNILKW